MASRPLCQPDIVDLHLRPKRVILNLDTQPFTIVWVFLLGLLSLNLKKVRFDIQLDLCSMQAVLPIPQWALITGKDGDSLVRTNSGSSSERIDNIFLKPIVKFQLD